MLRIANMFHWTEVVITRANYSIHFASRIGLIVIAASRATLVCTLQHSARGHVTLMVPAVSARAFGKFEICAAGPACRVLPPYSAAG